MNEEQPIDPEHKAQPIRRGRFLECKICGGQVAYIRHKVRTPHFRHVSGSSINAMRYGNEKWRSWQ